jgi:hypothetical protein
MQQSQKQNLMIAVAAVVLFYGLFRIYAYYDLCTAPFKVYNQDQARAVLAEIGSGNCQAFVDRYIKPAPTNDFAIFARGLAYDKGLCVPQDLAKAVEYYERSVIWYHPIISPLLRLGMIYDYGPRRLHNGSRADYLFRQAAIAFAPFTNDQLRRQYIKKSSNSDFMPGPLKRELTWLDKYMMRNGSENRHMALEIDEAGISGTTGLWSELTPRNQEINIAREQARLKREAMQQPLHEAAPDNYTAPRKIRPPSEPIPGIDNAAGN